MWGLQISLPKEVVIELKMDKYIVVEYRFDMSNLGIFIILLPSMNSLDRDRVTM